MWFSQSEDSTVTDIVESVNSLQSNQSHLLIAMAKYLVKELLKTLDQAIPSYIETLDKEEAMEVRFV